MTMTASRAGTEPYLFLCHQCLAYVVEALFLTNKTSSSKEIHLSFPDSLRICDKSVVCYYLNLETCLIKA